MSDDRRAGTLWVVGWPVVVVVAAVCLAGLPDGGVLPAVLAVLVGVVAVAVGQRSYGPRATAGLHAPASVLTAPTRCSVAQIVLRHPIQPRAPGLV
ncbi:hypothetical protein FB459_2411 [Yimella lutea]|uniref:Uncharacterized protein n=1 Tax=Yimella lutea TaxID=587872 RepID=A0A542EHT6_9MICO|nr:hypothetical protein [Yimella lutea]TQJ14895.1 hypothetical protein FB459_2411 [Yimella lutea]